MKASLEIDTDQPRQLQRAVGPSLRSQGSVTYSYRFEENCFKVDIETEGLGPLRGSTDSVFRLVGLSKRLR